jgi:hypothetical protein
VSSEGGVVRGKFRPSRGLVASVRPEPRPDVPRVSRTRAERLARQLALAHWIERAVEDGRVGNYGEVARALGLTESRITQITALLGLSPTVQEAVLLGEGAIGIREAIKAARNVEWPPVLSFAGRSRSARVPSRLNGAGSSMKGARTVPGLGDRQTT